MLIKISNLSDKCLISKIEMIFFYKFLLLTCFSLIDEAVVANDEITREIMVTKTNVETKTNAGGEKQLRCRFAHGLVVGDRKRQLECCTSTVHDYHNRWLSRNRPLNRYLASLKEWNCPQFEQECKKRLFVYNTFTDLMYDYFCNYSSYVDKCHEDVIKTLNKSQQQAEQNFRENKTFESLGFSDSFNSANWKKLITQIDPSLLTVDELLEPCIQVAQYDQEEIHDGGYQEVVKFAIPFCGISWCGFGAKALKEHKISFGTCLKPR